MTESLMDTPEYSYPISVESLGTSPKRFSLTVGETERVALAKRFDLVSIETFTAEVTVHRVSGSSLVQVRGSFAADIVQRCVVTEDPVPEHVEETFSVYFGPEAATEAEIDVYLDEEDPPEPIQDDVIELGEWLAQMLAIEMNPYPKAPGAELEVIFEEDDTEKTSTYRPFEALLSGKKDQA